ncbi:MAG: ABC transporter permease [Clostridia bacterium]|nr:ABC transporter permease [Clostridia bacterium]
MRIANKIIKWHVYAFLYLPLIIMIFFSFNSAKSTSVFESFSFKWYGELFSSSDTLEALRNTLILALASALIATVLGTLAALGIYMVRNKIYKQSMLSVTNIPLMNPDIVTGVSLMLLFVFVGRALGFSQYLNFWTLLIAHVTFNLPYVILNVLPKLNQTDKSLFEAAQDLGAPPPRAFFMVVLPQIVPGIISGAIMAFTLSLDDFVISYYTSSGFQTLPLKIYSMTKKVVKPDMYALSSLIFLVVLVLLLGSNIFQMRAENKTSRVLRKEQKARKKSKEIAV